MSQDFWSEEFELNDLEAGWLRDHLISEHGANGTFRIVPSALRIGDTLRGLMVNGQTLFYRTEEENNYYWRCLWQEEYEKKKADFSMKLPDLEIRLSQLPEFFRKKIERTDSDWCTLERDLVFFEQAYLIASHCKNSALEIDKLERLPFEEQKALVPALEQDYLAHAFLQAWILCFNHGEKMYAIQDNEMQRIRRIFAYQAPNENQVRRFEQARSSVLNLAIQFSHCAPASRELSLALTKLEEALMHFNSAIARNEVVDDSERGGGDPCLGG